MVHVIFGYADCVNMFGGSIHTIRKTQSFVVARKQTELEVTAGKTKYMVMSRDQNAGRSHRIKIDTSSLKVWNSSNIWEQP